MITFVDLFCGAGGLSIGLEQAGLKCVAGVELDRDACSTFRAAHPHASALNTPTQEVDFRKFSGVDLIAGGPPCQPFSSGGKQLAQDDQRDMIPEFIRAVREARPRMFLMENVPGLVSPVNRVYFEGALAKLRALGYEVQYQVVNAAEYGVPQKRRRLVVVGTATQEKFEFPQPTHGPRGHDPYVPARIVVNTRSVRGTPNLSKVTYAKTPDLRPSPYDGHLFNGGGRAIDLDAPCHTILASAGGNKTHFIDTQNEVPRYHRHLISGGAPRTGLLESGRRLSVEESAAIQTFPENMVFAGARSSQYRQVGNAVPPRLAKALGTAIREQCSHAKSSPERAGQPRTS